ncbi:MAG: DUF378 domain-containing protein [Patescibacteria group bacterium]
MKHKGFHGFSYILLIIGGLNWLLVGLGGLAGSDWNVVHMILGSWAMLEWLVYLLVGLAALYEIFTHKGRCKDCVMKDGSGMGGGQM